MVKKVRFPIFSAQTRKACLTKKRKAIGMLCAALPLVMTVSLWNPNHMSQIPADHPGVNDSILVKQTRTIPRMQVSYADSGRIYGVEDHFVYESLDSAKTFHVLGDFSRGNTVNPAKDRLARSWFVRRFRMNLGPKNLIVLKSGTIIIIYDRIYRSTDHGRSFEVVFREPFLEPFPHGVAIDAQQNIYFGEYDCRPRPHPIRIFRGKNDGRNWSVCYTFNGSVFHVHTIKPDPFRNCLWICTGDEDRESNLFYTADDFRTLNKLGGGDQDWRICALEVRRDDLIWCSDNSDYGSGIFRYNFQAARREKIKFIGNPCYYSMQLPDGTIAFSTAFEEESLYGRTHPETRSADIWISKTGQDWRRVVSLRSRPGKARPQILFPSGSPGPRLFFTPINTDWDAFTIQDYAVQWQK